MRRIKTVKNQKTHSELSGKFGRINLLAIFVFILFFIVISRLYYLQVVSYDTYRAIADNQHKMTAEVQAQRGEIFLSDDDDLYPLSVNRQFNAVYAVPKEIEDRNFAAEKLAEILGVDRNLLTEKFSNENDPFEMVKKKLSEEEEKKIKELNIRGIHFFPEIYRYYPGGELASQVVGFVGPNGEKTRGMYGLEAFWEKELRGEAGMLSQERDSRGRWISVSDRDLKPAQNGVDLVLTINHTVQYEIEKILKDSIVTHSADKGSIIVMQPKSGKILAMANYPNFNPNEYSKTEDISFFSNPSVSSLFEPGSIFKTITEAAGIEDGKINPDSVYVDTGLVREAGYEIRNSDFKAYGLQTMTNVLEKSLNTGVIFIEKQIGNNKFADYVRKFGFGEKTEIDVPAEISGNIANIEKTNQDINFFTASFGQGISVTPLQIVNAYGALANGGVLMKPQIIDRMKYSDGREKGIESVEKRRVVSEETARQVSEMLRSVVLYGHGKRADVPGYKVGGKTGTAQVPKSDGRGYEDGLTIGSFAGYAPTDDPQFVVLVEIYNPKDVQWAESTAAPAFGKVMKFLLEYYKIKPTEDPTISPMYRTIYQATPVQPVQENTQNSEADDEAIKKDEKKKKD